LYLLLVKPPVEVSTSKAFQYVVPQKPAASISELINLPVQDWKNNLMNQFESSVFPQYPEISNIKRQLYEFGAVYASMSGSGSCVFGFFNELPESLGNLFPASHLTFSQKI